MPLSKKIAISIISAVIVLSIAVGLAVASPSLLNNDGRQPDGESENGGDNNNGGIVEVDNGEEESCQPPQGANSSPDTSTEDMAESGIITIGNPIGTDRVPSITALTIKNPDEKISFRFTAKYSGEVQSLAINLLHPAKNQTAFQVGIQEDDGTGSPTGEWVTPPREGNFLPDRNGFVTMNLEDVSLVGGKVYHVVIEATAPAIDVGNELDIRAYDVYLPFQPFNEDKPEILWQDKAMDALFYDGTLWRDKKNWPVFVISYSDGRALGEPYSLAAQWVIYQGRHTGQQIVPSSDYSLERFAFLVAANGKPADNLCYEIRNSNNDVMAKGFFAGPDSLYYQAQFVEVELDKPLTLEKDKIYRIALYSHGTVFEEPYHLYGHEFVYDEGIGYGGLRNILTASYDKGSTWRDWTDADTIFNLSVNPT